MIIKPFAAAIFLLLLSAAFWFLAFQFIGGGIIPLALLVLLFSVALTRAASLTPPTR